MSAAEILDDPAFSDAALVAAADRRAQRAEMAGRAEPPRRNPDLYEVRPTRTLVALLESVIDADPGLVDFVEENLAAARAYTAAQKGIDARPGRPAELPLRTALIAFLLLAHKEPNFHVLNLPGLLGALPAADRRRLGIDRLVKVPNTGLAGTEARYEPGQVTYRQLLIRLHNIADAFDPTLDGLDDDERVRRAVAQQNFVLRAVNAPRRALLPDWQPDGDLAGDATLKWAWDRPPGVQGKVARRGADGDAGSPLALSDIITEDDTIDDLGFDADGTAGDDQPSAAPPIPGINRADRRRLRRRWRRGGADWVGRRNPANSVYGYAAHTLVNGGDGPCVIMHMAVTPAPANPAGSLLPLLRHLHDERLTEPLEAHQRPLGDVSADGAYTGTHAWQLGLRAMGASPIFRLHPTNQEGRRLVDGFTFLNGRPICECCPTELDEPWPAFRHRPTRAQIAAHHDIAEARRRWEWKANGTARPDGARQFLAPHRGTGPDGERGGCERCVHADGTPAVDDDGLPLPRCCTAPTKVFTAEQLVWYQDDTFGTKAWYDKWNVRDRVEGTYGVLKNLGLVNYGRDYHHFVGQGHESVVAVFAAMAHNMHMIASWVAQQAHAARKAAAAERGLPKPSAVPTQTIAADEHPATVAAPAPRKAPKGLAELGADPPPG